MPPRSQTMLAPRQLFGKKTPLKNTQIASNGFTGCLRGGTAARRAEPAPHIWFYTVKNER